MRDFPKLSNYHPKGKNSNTLVFEANGLVLYFSYKIIVAFQSKGKFIVSENIWGNTTGRHIGYIDGQTSKTKKADNKRLKREEFEIELSKTLLEHNL